MFDIFFSRIASPGRRFQSSDMNWTLFKNSNFAFNCGMNRLNLSITFVVEPKKIMTNGIKRSMNFSKNLPVDLSVTDNYIIMYECIFIQRFLRHCTYVYHVPTIMISYIRSSVCGWILCVEEKNDFLVFKKKLYSYPLCVFILNVS